MPAELQSLQEDAKFHASGLVISSFQFSEWRVGDWLLYELTLGPLMALNMLPVLRRLDSYLVAILSPYSPGSSFNPSESSVFKLFSE